MIKNLTVNVLKNFDVDKKTIHKIVGKLKTDLDFNIIGMQINFVDEKEIKKINKEYLKHNYSTDIITFDYSESKKYIDGEIYISIDDAASNAKKYNVPLEEEIVRLVIHGFLHLLGYDDKSQKEKVIMKALEEKILNDYRLIVN